jgi:hypothetical protein
MNRRIRGRTEREGKGMNIKNSAYDAVLKKLEDELATVQGKVSRNRWNFKCLAEEQSKLKRERGVLNDLINDLKERRKINVKEQGDV